MLLKQEIKTLRRLIKHLPGRHDQQSHGRRFASPSDENALAGMSREPRHMKMRKAYSEWFASITKEEQKAITLYTGPHYDEMNSHLRGEEDHSEYKDAIEHAMTGLQKGSAPFAFQVVRGMYASAAVDALWKHFQKNTGKIFTDPAFGSTTIDLDEETQKGVNVHIHIPKGAKGAYVALISDSPNEHEFLIPPKSSFKVVKTYVDSNGLRHLELAMAR